MAGFAVSIRLDDRRFEAAITDLEGKVKIAAAEGSKQAAELVRDLIKASLLEYAHPRAEPTASPPYKGPVGSLVDTAQAFHLRESIHAYPMAIEGFWKVSADAIYARIQEFGGWTGGVRHIYHKMTPAGFIDVSAGFTSETHMTYLPPRPYFKPMVMEIDTDPEGLGIERIYYAEWRKAMIRAVAF